MTTLTTIIGNLTDDPEIRILDNGRSVARLGVAVNRRRYDRQTNKWVEAGTDYHSVVAWGTLAENSACLRRGDRVIAAGSLESRNWTDSDQRKRVSWEIVATAIGAEIAFAEVQIRKNPPKTGTSPTQGQSPAQRPSPQGPAPTQDPWYTGEPPF